MNPRKRADKVRSVYGKGDSVLRDLLPPGSLILTPDEAEQVSTWMWIGEYKRVDDFLAGKGQT